MKTFVQEQKDVQIQQIKQFVSSQLPHLRSAVEYVTAQLREKQDIQTNRLLKKLNVKYINTSINLQNENRYITNFSDPSADSSDDSSESSSSNLDHFRIPQKQVQSYFNKPQTRDDYSSQDSSSSSNLPKRKGQSQFNQNQDFGQMEEEEESLSNEIEQEQQGSIVEEEEEQAHQKINVDEDSDFDASEEIKRSENKKTKVNKRNDCKTTEEIIKQEEVNDIVQFPNCGSNILSFEKQQDVFQTYMVHNKQNVKGFKMNLQNNDLLDLLMHEKALLFHSNSYFLDIRFNFSNDLFQQREKIEQGVLQEIDQSNQPYAQEIFELYEQIVRLVLENKQLFVLKLVLPSHSLFLWSKHLSLIQNKSQHTLRQLKLKNLELNSVEFQTQLLNQLEEYPNLKNISLEINIVNNAVVNSINKLLQKVSRFNGTFNQISNELSNSLVFKQHYTKLKIKFCIDIYNETHKLEAFLSSIAAVQSVEEKFKMINNAQFERNNTTTLNAIQEYIAYLKTTVQNAIENSKKKYILFQHIQHIKAQELFVSTPTHQMIFDSLSHFIENNQSFRQKIALKQISPYCSFIPFNLEQSLSAMLEVDHSSVFEQIKKSKSTFLIFNAKNILIEKLNSHYQASLSCLKQLNNFIIPKQIESVSLRLTNIENIAILNDLCEFSSSSHLISQLAINVQLDSELHEQLQRGQINHIPSHCYFYQLSSLQYLQNLSLTLHLDQRIIDSIAQIFMASESIQKFYLERKSINQYNLDFSYLIDSFGYSQSLQNVELKINLSSIKCQFRFKKQWNEQRLNFFYFPLQRLLSNSKNTLQELKLLCDHFEQHEIDVLLHGKNNSHCRTKLSLPKRYDSSIYQI